MNIHELSELIEELLKGMDMSKEIDNFTTVPTLNYEDILTQ